MNDAIKMSVQSRKDAIFNSYEIHDEKLLKMIDDYFKKLEEYAKGFSDPMEFETAFANNKLAKEYSDLFTKIMGSGITASGIAKDASESVVSEIAHDAKIHARRKARMEAESQLRDIPIVGDILHVKQHVDFFSRFKKNRKEDSEDE